MMMEAAHTSETSVDSYFTPQYIPEDKSELQKKSVCSCRLNLTSQGQDSSPQISVGGVETSQGRDS
jgi:hypothetical protein